MLQGRENALAGERKGMPRCCDRRLYAAIATLAVMVRAGPVFAVDGVIEINQAKAAVGGVTTGDTQGFPVTISQSGSYRLTGNLTLSDPAKTAIQVIAPHVTIDLNGFSIVGPVTCSGCPVTSCTSGTGIGIDGTDQEDTVVLNGIVSGMGSDGILLGDRSRVEGVLATQNGGAGISASVRGMVFRSQARSNQSTGIRASGDGDVHDSKASCNGASGIAIGRGTVEGSSASLNFGFGIQANGAGQSAGSAVINNNVSTSNSQAGIACSDAACSVIDNVVRGNDGAGIFFEGTASSGFASGNSVIDNGGRGLSLQTNVGYGNNVMSANTEGCTLSGVALACILCDGTKLCPFN